MTHQGQYSLVQAVSTKPIISEIDWFMIPIKCYEDLINLSRKTAYNVTCMLRWVNTDTSQMQQVVTRY